jgi:CDP-glycerol glycerophosphotransferase (TagB/SpsB family)/GT2 family glycosyltransferase
MLLSIGMMVKNEEKYLEECLQGLKPILDEVDSELIIVDTGSTDRTVEIAKKYTNRVYYHEWTGHFGEMRNTVLEYAKGQWFFFIDADEIIDDYTDIINFFTSDRHKKANAAFFLIKNLLSRENNDSYAYSHILRFFRKDKEFHFRGAVHEQPVYKLPVAQIKASAVHYGYMNDDAGLMEYKYIRNVEILENELEKDPENVYYWYQLAQSYGMYGDKDKGLDAILKAYSLMKADKKPKHRISVYILLANIYLVHGMYKKVIEVCNEGCRLREGYFDLYYFRAMSHFELGNYKDALKSFKQYLEGVEKFLRNEGLVDLSMSYMTVRFYEHALHYVCVIYKRLENYQKALEYAEKINDKAVYKSIIPHVVEIYMEQQRFEDLKKLYETKAAEDEDSDEVFLNAFEGYRWKLNSQQKEYWSKLFAGESSGYGLLNRIRLLEDTDDISPSLIERICSLDWRKAPVFCGELIWALMKQNIAVITILKDLQEYKLNALLEHMAKSSRRFASKLLDYLKDQGLWRSERPDPEKLRVKVIMLRSILVFDGLSESDYEEAFDEYVADGITNLKNLYNRDVIDNEKVSFMKTNADAFMLYMYKAKEYFQKDKVSYVRYLRKALDVDNQMKKGIQILQQRVSDALKKPQSELELHKQKIIQTIEDAINGGDIEAAKVLLDEYQDIVGVDAKACSIKSVILMVEQRFEEARQVILEGLKLEPDNSDLLYNMEYLNDLLGQAGQAASGGECSHHDTNTVEPALKSDQDSTGNANGTGYKILIASPIRQKPAILKEFLVSLRELDTSGFDIWYLFVDDNTDPESSAILNTFSKKVPNVMVHRADTGDKYVCDDVTHHWKERLIWKVAAFKDMMIKIADEYGFDYIFFIDSDLVLHPLTLRELVDSNKDIISNIFWTKWQPDAPKLPQVWLMDTYIQHQQARDEKVNQETVLVRRQHFLNKLKRPGIYEVGGLGACTLISRKAIKLGVSFSQIPNLSFWGEDRHFCIRAAALGLKLYVNTRYPAYHIYRESDLEGVGSYKIRAAKGEYLYKPVITLVYTSLSGSNTWALYKCVPEYIKGRFDVELVVQDNSANYYGTVMNSDVVVVTEGNYNLDKKLFNPDQIVIDLWHGFPLKSMGYADKGEKFINTLPAIWANINYIGSYSPMFNRVMEKCIRAGDEKYRVWGAPRNDLLLGSSGRDALVELLGIKNADERRFIVYMPTYRYSPRGDRNDGNKDWSNIFGLPGFDEERFNEFLRSRNLHLVVKLHPAEERKFAERIKNRSNITLLTGGKLYEKKMDLYEVLNAASLLITDYSSVYFDFLLLDRPIVFVPSDRKDYARNRGFLVDDFDKWTPGPKAFNQDQLEAEIEKSVSDGNYYGTERETVRELVHSYKDANSGKRVWDFIGGLLEK